jgi:hypothetical protein
MAFLQLDVPDIGGARAGSYNYTIRMAIFCICSPTLYLYAFGKSLVKSNVCVSICVTSLYILVPSNNFDIFSMIFLSPALLRGRAEVGSIKV